MVERGVTPLRLLILGGTTFLGVHMTARALRRGHGVTLFNRGSSRPELFPDLEHLRGDRDGQLESLRGKRWDAVIDNSGYVPRHVRLSAELLTPSVHQYLFVSTISVYAELSRVNDESSALAVLEDETCEDPKQAYGALKARCELAAQSALPGRTTIVRPGLIVGPEDPTDRFTYWPARAACGGEMLAPGEPGAFFQLIDARDLADFCIATVEQRLLGVFNVTSSPGHFTMGDVVTESVSAACELVKPTPPPTPTWVPEAFLMQKGVKAFTDLPGWLPGGGDLAKLHHTRVDRALAAGLRVSPLSKTVRDTLTWHLGRAPASRGNLRAGVSAERERELLARWHSRADRFAPRSS